MSAREKIPGGLDGGVLYVRVTRRMKTQIAELTARINADPQVTPRSEADVVRMILEERLNLIARHQKATFVALTAPE